MKKKLPCRSYSSRSKLLKFTICEDCTGEVTVFDGKVIIFCSATGTHQDKIQELGEELKRMKREVALLEKALLELKQHSGELSCTKKFP